MLNLKRLTSFVLLLVVAFAIYGCSSSSGGGNRIVITGLVTSVNGQGGDELVGITVEAINPQNFKRLGSAQVTGLLGEYQLRVPLGNNLTRLIILTFTTLDLEIFTGSFVITKNSSVLLDVMLTDGDVDIDDDDGPGYTVLSNRIKTSGKQQFLFSNADFGIDTPGQALFIVNGNAANCINATDNSLVVINPNTFQALDCDVGISTRQNGNVFIEASDLFEILSRNAGIRTRNQTVVDVTASESGTFTIESNQGFGIRCSGQSLVTAAMDPTPGTCSVSGAQGDIEEETANCDIMIPNSCLTP